MVGNALEVVGDAPDVVEDDPVIEDDPVVGENAPGVDKAGEFAEVVLIPGDVDEDVPLAPVEPDEMEVMDWDPQEADHSGLMQHELVMRRINEARQLEDAQGEVDAALEMMREQLDRHGVEGVLPELRWGVRRWVEEERRGVHFMQRILQRIEVEVLGCRGVELPRERRPRDVMGEARAVAWARQFRDRLARIARREAQISAPRGRSRSPRVEAASSSSRPTSTMAVGHGEMVVNDGVLAVENELLAVEDGLLAVVDGTLAVAEGSLESVGTSTEVMVVANEGEEAASGGGGRAGEARGGEVRGSNGDEEADSDATTLLEFPLPLFWTASPSTSTTSSNPLTLSTPGAFSPTTGSSSITGSSSTTSGASPTTSRAFPTTATTLSTGVRGDVGRSGGDAWEVREGENMGGGSFEGEGDVVVGS